MVIILASTTVPISRLFHELASFIMKLITQTSSYISYIQETGSNERCAFRPAKRKPVTSLIASADDGLSKTNPKSSRVSPISPAIQLLLFNCFRIRDDASSRELSDTGFSPVLAVR